MKHPPETPRSSSSARSIAQSISARFEEQVVANRERLAVSAADRSLSYGALNEAANRVARAVLATAPHTDTVAVLIGQGASVIVAMLGVLKAGKIFVPLDTRQPVAGCFRFLTTAKPGCSSRTTEPARRAGPAPARSPADQSG